MNTSNSMSWTGLEYDPRAADKGLIAVWAYYCNRCNYVWLPKDFDVAYDNTLDRELPKACARCKSKYWNRLPLNEDNNRNSIKRFEAFDNKILTMIGFSYCLL